MMNVLKRLWKEEEGQGMTEYGLIVGVVSVALIVTLVALKDKLVAIFQGITNDANTPSASTGS